MKKLLLILSAISIANISAISQKELDFRFAMNKLWNDHGVWTHEAIVELANDAPTKDLVSERLLKNQEDIGNAIAPVYGNKAGNQLTKLLKEHILISVDVVNAAKNNKMKELKTAQAKWDKNARQIAKFLAKANSNFTYNDLIKMLREHLDLTTQEALAILKKDKAQEILLYDKVRKQLDHMAKDLADGIIKQFPEKFE